MAAPRLLLLDSSVLIDYCAADRTVLTLVTQHVGQIQVPSVILAEVADLDESECERLGLIVVEPDTALLVQAGRRRPGLSYEDHLCLLVAKASGWTCVTNDGRLRRECGAEKVPVLWGLELLPPLVADGHLTSQAARTVLDDIHAANPFFVTAEIVRTFAERINEAARNRKK